jgi:hypothetical protein
MSDEDIAQSFSAWDAWGRGWYSTTSPVAPEPPLFELDLGPNYPAPVDDGIHESVIGRVFRFLSGTSEAEKENSRSSGIGELLAPSRVVGETELIQLSMGFGRELRDVGSLKMAAAFIETLRSVESPVAFELVRRGCRTEVQVVVDRVDGSFIAHELEAYFPGLQVEETEVSDMSVFSNTGAHPLVVEFGLSSSFFLPLRLSEEFVSDPYIGLVGAFEQCRDGDSAVFQVLFEPVGSKWSSSVNGLYESGIFEGVSDDAARLIRRKCKGPLYGVVCRLGVVSDCPGREWDLARSMAGSLVAFDNRDGNELIPISNDADGTRYDEDVHVRDLLARESRRHGMILSRDELVGLVHVPSAQVAKLIVGTSVDEKRAPELSDGQVCLGENIVRGVASEVVLPKDYRSRHMHVIGASGSGKSNFLLHAIRQEIEIGTSTIVIDPHGDLVDSIFGHITSPQDESVILFDVADEEYPIGFNPLSANSDRERMQLESDIVAIFRRFSTSWGDQMTTVLSNAIQLVLEAQSGGTIVDVRRVLMDKAFRNGLLESVDDPECKLFWTVDFPQIRGTPITSIITRLNAFFRPRAVRHILAQRNSKFDLEAAVNSGKTILFRIPQGVIGEENTFILGSLILAKLNLIAQGRASMPAERRHPTVCYIDEFHSMITPSLRSMLEGARKFDFGLVLAHQELRQLDSRGETVGSSLLANAATRMVFRVSDSDARVLEREFQSFTAESLARLRIGECICRIGSADQDFNLRIPLVQLKSEIDRNEQYSRLRDRARREFARSREEVARDLAGKSADSTVDEDEKKIVISGEDVHGPIDIAVVEPSEEIDFSGSVSLEIEKAPSSSDEVPDSECSDIDRPVEQPVDEVKVRAPASPGRGGKRHKDIQRRLCDLGHKVGFRADIEFEIPDGRGSVDVAIRGESTSIACEIGLTTSVVQEIENVRKCLAAEFTYVLAISEIESRLKKIRAGVRKTESSDAFKRTRYFLIADAEHFIQSIAAESKTSERTVRGYKVKRSVVSVSSREQLEKETIIEKTLAKALQEKRKSRRSPKNKN